MCRLQFDKRRRGDNNIKCSNYLTLVRTVKDVSLCGIVKHELNDPH